MSRSSSTKHSGRVDEELLAKLESAGFEIDHALCYDKNPTLHVIYKRYTVGNNIMNEVEKMVNARKWPRELGKPPNQAEIIRLFVAKTTWYKSYVKVLSRLKDEHKDMKAWLQDDPDNMPDDLDELWEGVGAGRSQYILGDLEDWLDLQDNKKKPPTKPTAAKKKRVEKGKAKETQGASGSGSGKGKEKAKESVGGKKSHKKVTKE
jgi:hypothetical protein